MLIPHLLSLGYIKTPWNHMTEAMEKSNHHAHKDYQTRTMRGGGLMTNEDPVYLDAHFSFCRLLDIFKGLEKGVTLNSKMRAAHMLLHGEALPDVVPTYKELCRVVYRISTMPLGSETPLPLLGMRFFILGRFGGSTTSESLGKMLFDAGATVLDKAKAYRIIRSHKITPHCYVVLKDDKELKIGTTTKTLAVSKKKGSQTISKTAIECRFLAGTNFTFINYQYIHRVCKIGHLEDPTPYFLQPGPEIKELKLNDKRPLLVQQCAPIISKKAYVSTFSSVKLCRAKSN
jgi:hypothetical protein